MFLGYRLKELRNNLDISQEELGNIIGVTKVSISGYENGTRFPSMDTLVKLLNYFNISADYILGRELNVVCEDDPNITISLSSVDISIINELRQDTALYNKLANNPIRFIKNNIGK